MDVFAPLLSSAIPERKLRFRIRTLQCRVCTREALKVLTGLKVHAKLGKTNKFVLGESRGGEMLCAARMN